MQSLCFFSGSIIETPVFMYRKHPDGLYDSGWRFFSGPNIEDNLYEPECMYCADLEKYLLDKPVIQFWIEAVPEGFCIDLRCIRENSYMFFAEDRLKYKTIKINSAYFPALCVTDAHQITTLKKCVHVGKRYNKHCFFINDMTFVEKRMIKTDKGKAIIREFSLAAADPDPFLSMPFTRPSAAAIL